MPFSYKHPWENTLLRANKHPVPVDPVEEGVKAGDHRDATNREKDLASR